MNGKSLKRIKVAKSPNHEYLTVFEGERAIGVIKKQELQTFLNDEYTDIEYFERVK